MFAQEIALKKAIRDKENKPKVSGRVGSHQVGEDMPASRHRGSQIDQPADRVPSGKRKASLQLDQHEEGQIAAVNRNSQLVIPDTAYHDGGSQREPLFAPGGSQGFREFSQREDIKQAGLGLEDMDDDELAKMMDLDGEDDEEGSVENEEGDEQQQQDDDEMLIDERAEESAPAPHESEGVNRSSAMVGGHDMTDDEEDFSEMPGTAAAQIGRQVSERVASSRGQQLTTGL